MLKLVREIIKTGGVHVILSSHLLRDVEECCEEVVILKHGQVAVYCNLEAERSANRKFVELEARGQTDCFIERVEALGCEWARSGQRRYKVVLPDGLEISQLYQTAVESDVELRRLSYKRDSLEDIFLKAMGADNGSL